MVLLGQAVSLVVEPKINHDISKGRGVALLLWLQGTDMDKPGCLYHLPLE